MPHFIFPKDYSSSLNLIETQRAIKVIKDFFERELANNLNLTRVSAPMFVKKSSGLNDNLNGFEKPVSFFVNDGQAMEELEIVHSLAKWKRYALQEYGLTNGTGIYTDMNAIRAHETVDNTHSYYVDQWDWEKVLSREERTEEYLKETVTTIYRAFKGLDIFLNQTYENYHSLLPSEIFFISSQELEDLYPELDPEDRERKITREHGAVFITQIGKILASGKKHDNRAPDYDDWELNGDLLLWNPILNDSLELSSMGIRVSPESLLQQLKATDSLDRLRLEFHSLLVNGRLPYTIGGGIGQSRICMYFLQKAHIGEVQASVWPESMRRICEKNNIFLL